MGCVVILERITDRLNYTSSHEPSNVYRGFSQNKDFGVDTFCLSTAALSIALRICLIENVYGRNYGELLHPERNFQHFILGSKLISLLNCSSCHGTLIMHDVLISSSLL